LGGAVGGGTGAAVAFGAKVGEGTGTVVFWAKTDATERRATKIFIGCLLQNLI
jgi:hypothetical protein